MSNKLDNTAFLTGDTGGFLENLYRDYLNDPESVGADWRAFFDELGEELPNTYAATEAAPWRRHNLFLETGEEPYQRPKNRTSKLEGRQATMDSIRALMMIRAYRVRGHLMAKLDPLNLESREYHPELDPKSYGFMSNDFDRPIFIDNVLGLERASVREIMDVLHRTYSV